MLVFVHNSFKYLLFNCKSKLLYCLFIIRNLWEFYYKEILNKVISNRGKTSLLPNKCKAQLKQICKKYFLKKQQTQRLNKG